MLHTEKHLTSITISITFAFPMLLIVYIWTHTHLQQLYKSRQIPPPCEVCLRFSVSHLVISSHYLSVVFLVAIPFLVIRSFALATLFTHHLAIAIVSLLLFFFFTFWTFPVVLIKPWTCHCHSPCHPTLTSLLYYSSSLQQHHFLSCLWKILDCNITQVPFGEVLSL